MITYKKLKSILTYNELTGIFVWLKTINPRALVGNVAGYDNGDGYIKIGFDGGQYYAHRLACLYMTGHYPDKVDHINGVVSDNRFVNLRDVSTSSNMKNKKLPKNNKSGVVGVSWSKGRGKWVAQIGDSRNVIYLGGFDDKSDAIDARKRANKIYRFHDNHGKTSKERSYTE